MILEVPSATVFRSSLTCGVCVGWVGRFFGGGEGGGEGRQELAGRAGGGT